MGLNFVGKSLFFPLYYFDYQFCLYSIADSCHLTNKLGHAEAAVCAHACACAPAYHLHAHHHVVPIFLDTLL